MQAIVQFLGQGWVGSTIGIGGLLVGTFGIWSYRRSRHTAKPAIQKSSVKLIGRDTDDFPSEMSVTFKGNEVERLTRTNIVFWNAGNDTLKGENIVASDPIRLSFDEGDRILRSRIITRTKTANDVSLSTQDEEEHSVFLGLDYLDPQDGVAIELLHNSDSRFPSVSGSIRGVSDGVSDLGRVSPNRPVNAPPPFNLILRSRKLVLIVAMLLGLTMFLTGVLPDELREAITGFFKSNDPIPKFDDSWILRIGGGFYMLLAALVLWSRRRRFPKSLDFSEMDT